MNARPLRLLPLVLLALAGCGGGSSAPPPAVGADLGLPGGKPREDRTVNAMGVNAYLWRGALDTLSFMPLASADPFGGVIITDWWQPPASPGERFKATAYVLSRQLRADGVRVEIFRQVQEGGQWMNAPVNRTITGDIENKVLARARELRAAGKG